MKKKNRFAPAEALIVLLLFACGGHATVKPVRVADDSMPSSARAEWPTALLAGTDAERVVVPAEGAPAKGATAPLVTIVEFSDFQCPFCARVNPTLEKLIENYPDDIQVVFRHNPMPFHKQAVPAAVVSLEAHFQRGDAGFWQAHDMLFANQDKLGTLEETAALIESIRRELGIQPVVEDQIDDLLGRIESDMELAARVGARGTPIFYINGRELSGAQPYAKFEAIVEEEIRLAKVTLERGAKREQLYALAMEVAQRAPAEPAFESEPEVAPTPTVDAQAAERYEVPVPDEAPNKGPKNAPVTVQIFSDFQCPFCSRVVPTIKTLEKEYRGKLRFVWYHYPLPFHQQAPLAHEASVEAFEQKGSKGFWRFHDMLFENQRELAADQLITYGKKAGLNPRKLSAALENRTHQARVKADIKRVEDAGMRIGTPTFLINGTKLSGAQPIELFRERIDSELEKLKE